LNDLCSGVAHCGASCGRAGDSEFGRVGCCDVVTASAASGLTTVTPAAIGSMTTVCAAAFGFGCSPQLSQLSAGVGVFTARGIVVTALAYDDDDDCNAFRDAGGETCGGDGVLAGGVGVSVGVGPVSASILR
jgi:hypothetical protein